jgi:hypothetical protein
MSAAHGWQLVSAPGGPESLARFLQPAIWALPSILAARLGHCRILLLAQFDDPERTSQWRGTTKTLEISVAVTGNEEHDVAMELLRCLGQALWEAISAGERAAYWRLIDGEIRAGIRGEIDEEALQAKQGLLANRESVRSVRMLESYGRASFAATAAEYVHSLWHDVTIREGPEYLPPPQLRQRLELLARWFPPDTGYRLFAVQTRLPPG